MPLTPHMHHYQTSSSFSTLSVQLNEAGWYHCLFSLSSNKPSCPSFSIFSQLFASLFLPLSSCLAVASLVPALPSAFPQLLHSLSPSSTSQRVSAYQHPSTSSALSSTSSFALSSLSFYLSPFPLLCTPHPAPSSLSFPG